MGKEYYNKIIGYFNIIKSEFNNLLPVMRNSNFKDYLVGSLSDYPTDFIYKNPVDFVFGYLQDLKLLGEEQGFDIFGRDSYIKYLYVAFFEQTFLKMIYCLNGINECINANPIMKRIRSQYYYNCVATYINSFEMIRSFSPNNIGEIYASLINDGDYVSFFKNGMFLSLYEAVKADADMLHLEVQKEMVDLVYEIVEKLEKDLASSSIDESSFDEVIAAASEKYCVDFASLDRGYTFKMEGDNNAQDTSSS